MSDVKLLEHNVIRSFSNAKDDVGMLKDNYSRQNDIIRQLYENQKKLVLRIRDIEKRLAEKTVEKVMEKKIVLTSAKTAPKTHFVGSQSALKFHDQICPFAKNIKPKNKIVFKSKVKAFNLGYKPCDCLKKV